MIYGSQSPRVVIATPMRDLQVSGPHYASAWTFMGSNLGIIDPQILVDDDLVRARSRAVRLFLETSAAHLLFWDSDVEGSAEALRGMIAEDVDCIASTYPKKCPRFRKERPSPRHRIDLPSILGPCTSVSLPTGSPPTFVA